MVELRKFLSIFCGKLRNLPGGLRRIVIQNQAATVRQWSEHSGVRSNNIQAVSFKLHFLQNVGAQRPASMREGGALEARKEFVCDGGAAYHGPALQHQWLKPRLGQIESRDQAVGAAADDNDLLSAAHSPQEGVGCLLASKYDRAAVMNSLAFVGSLNTRFGTIIAICLSMKR